MKILVANLGSTSFKYRLFEMEPEREVMLAAGGHERVTDYGEAIDRSLADLRAAGHLAEGETVDAVGFKTVLGKNLTGCVPADDRVIEALEGLAVIAPAHNPAYAAGIRGFAERLPEAKRVALFETAFYQWMPEPARRYAVPKSWHEAGVRRHGFHGASHKYVAERSAELLGRDDLAEAVRQLYRDGPATGVYPPCRVVSCHLGGSSSITAIRDGVAVGTSMGMSPQSGLPQNNRVGDLDSAAAGFAQSEMGLGLDEVNRVLTKESGLLGLSGVSNDLRDIREAADAGNADARLALDFLVHSVRGYLGSYVFQMGGLEALVFTAGIGENQPALRADICAGLEELGLVLDAEKNAALRGGEGEISREDSPVRIFVIPANEELVVARETWRLLRNN